MEDSDYTGFQPCLLAAKKSETPDSFGIIVKLGAVQTSTGQSEILPGHVQPSSSYRPGPNRMARLSPRTAVSLDWI
ncbi:hypothetical protein RRG08_022676 [Elysia crispata]|uniref:Uncharacterized protein n=1 Tax=Elysia crispata TaxID=231223 RepID=A0AAE0Z3N4_9GAST|nr:hypothetical protein RRG08_022676 [Elysia crispata]